MSEITTFGAGYDIYNVGGIGEVWEEPRRRRLFDFLGGRASDTTPKVQLRLARVGIPTHLPPFRVIGRDHAGLLSIPSDFEETVAGDYPGIAVRPAVISTTPEGWTLAGELPEEVELGAVSLRLERHSSTDRVRVLASPASDSAPSDQEIRTALYRFSQKGREIVPAALGLLVGGKAIVLPRRLGDGSPVFSMPLSPRLTNWASASGTPII